MACLRNISVDTLHKGDTEDDDDNNNNNNNNGQLPHSLDEKLVDIEQSYRWLKYL